MRKLPIIFFLLFISIQGKSQVVFKTIAPTKPVVAGESFRVQYVIEGAESIHGFSPPSFKGFRIVGGPEVYTGDAGNKTAPRPLKNTIYTLQAIEPGRYFLQGAVAVINGSSIRSNDALIYVISKDVAQRKKQLPGRDLDNMVSLRPGEDPYEKIRQNLFLKVYVDKKTCYAGEPVVATFKLYSRLQSKSDIIKNPGFYGFSVHDMINLDDKMVNTEEFNGKEFDVHTIRQVQLYPLQAGIYTIDAMEVKNKVEFSRSVVNKKAEQEIIEGVVDEDSNDPGPGNEVYETNLSTTPIRISVRSLPSLNKPADYNGATGRFQISAKIEEPILSRNEQGFLSVWVRGKGNFTQLDAPIIPWPKGVEGFEPIVLDSLDKSKSPLEGSRRFRYAFVVSQPGAYQLSPITMSFFDPATNKYSKKQTEPLSWQITNREKPRPVTTVPKASITAVNKKASFIAAAIVGGLVLLALVYFIFSGKKKPEHVSPLTQTPTLPSIESCLAPAFLMIPAADKDFYSTLSAGIWNYLAPRFGLAGTTMNKKMIAMQMKEAGKEDQEIWAVMDILQHCEAGMFTNAELNTDKDAFLIHIKKTLGSL